MGRIDTSNLLEDTTSLDYLKDENCNPYTEDEELFVFNKYKTITCPDEKIKLRNEILMHNQKLVVSIAKYYKNASQTFFSLEDLINEGNIGLIRAVDMYDNSSGNKFGTYATYWIRQAISRYITQSDSLIRVPVNLKLLWIKISAYIGEYYSAHSRFPSDKEVLDNIKGLTMDELINYYAYINLNKDVLSLNMQINSDESEDSELQDYVMSESSVEDSVVDSVCRDNFENKVDEILYKGIRRRILTERDVQVFKKRFGFGLDSKMTLQALGDEYGCSKERIRQIETKVLRYFKRPANKVILKENMTNMSM